MIPGLWLGFVLGFWAATAVIAFLLMLAHAFEWGKMPNPEPRHEEMAEMERRILLHWPRYEHRSFSRRMAQRARS